MAHLEKQIERIRQERQIQRRMRRSIPVPQVAFVGYTNAGKSTLLNALLRGSAGAPKADRHQVYADDKLFATLDPTTRRVRLPSGHIILFSDTVGFIRKLPTELVAAFRATLEEVSNSDLLVHVVDASDPDWKSQEATVLDILKDIGVDQLPRLTAYNKMDRLSPSQRDGFNNRSGVLLSATTGDNLKGLLVHVERQLAAQWVERKIWIPYKEGHRLARLHDYMDVVSQEMTSKGIRMKVRAHPATLAQWFTK